MTGLIKLTTTNDTTRNGMRWGVNVEHTAPGGQLCTSEVLHAYRTREHAAVFAPIHDQTGERHWWSADGDVCTDDGTKVGCTRLRTVARIEPLTLTTEQRVEIAIRCAMAVCDNPAWRAWAETWLSGADRSRTAAAASRTMRTMRASRASRASSRASSWAASLAASWAAEAAEAAEAAPRAASWAEEEASRAASWAAGVYLPSIVRSVLEKKQ